MPAGSGKAAGALRTISEVTAETGVAAHVLRYWETKVPQLRPVTRAGGRRYYRPDDVALVTRIAGLLGDQGYTIRGVQKLLATEGKARAATTPDALAGLRAIRDRLAAALAEDR